MSYLRSKIRSLQGEVSPVFGKPWSLLAAVALIGLWHGLALAREASVTAAQRPATNQTFPIQEAKIVYSQSWWHQKDGETRPIKITVTKTEGMTWPEFDTLLAEAEARTPNNADPPAGG